MAGYQPLYITGMETGLVQERQEFLLPNDAYPVLENAYVWRERIKRKQGYQLLARLRRGLTAVSIGDVSSGTVTLNLFTLLGINVSQPNAEFQPGSATTPIIITIAAPINQILTDATGTGTMVISGAGTIITAASINYVTGVLSLTFSGVVGPSAATITAFYYPGLPVMGLLSKELNNINNEQLVAFDQIYAYKFIGTEFQEYIPGTTWTGNNSDFFWGTNYWVNASNLKLFWVTNFNTSDPIRYTDGATWTNFAPSISSGSTDLLNQCRAILPFRGRLLVFNTFEGGSLGTSTQYRQRIRWSAIGSPLTATSWQDDITGQGGFLDIPTAQDIVSVGFVRDNLVIYCESSTWQLRYTGRSIAPFQIEKVNTELGAESTFSAVQFDTSIVAVGDKGIVECDSFKSELIDVKIPDLVFSFNNQSNGPKRVHGIRDYPRRLAYWTYPYKPAQKEGNIYPNRRLVYNYENDSWAIFTDSLTTLGTYQPQQSRKWNQFTGGTWAEWKKQNYSWKDRPSLFPAIIGGNQQGFVEYLDAQVSNDISLTIQNITGHITTPTVIRSPDHNLLTNQVIQIEGIISGTSFDNLNDGIFGVKRVDKDSFQIWQYSSITDQFTNPQLDPAGTYIGGGKISIRDGFSIVSKKFNAMDQGQNIQIGFIDVLMDNTAEGAITLNVYVDYNDNAPSNRAPQNANPDTSLPDTFFNSVVPTTNPQASTSPGLSKNWHRVMCATRGAFLTIEWTLSNAQLVGVEQESEVQIDAQVLFVRNAGKQMPIA